MAGKTPPPFGKSLKCFLFFGNISQKVSAGKAAPKNTADASKAHLSQCSGS